MNRWSALAALLALAAALALRVPNLALRPLHNDEAVNATKATELWERGKYAYDPDEYHGPTLHYASVPFFWLSGAKNADELPDAALRWGTVAFGVGLIFLLPLFGGAGGLGKRELAWAAIFLAISPAMVFYSRYFIHEMLLVFFSAVTIGAGWKYFAKGGGKEWAALAGAGVGLMFATKETFVISVGAMVLGVVGTVWWIRRPSPQPSPEGRGRNEESFDVQSKPEPNSNTVVNPLSLWERVRVRDLAIAIAACLLIWLLFFSSFFTNLSGLADSIRTYLPWLKRAGGHSPHIHRWYFYLQRLAWFHPVKGPIWSEGLILILAAIGGLVSLKRRSSGLAVFLTIYTGLLTVIYSAISYKTPWCLLNFLLGMILLAGVGAATVVEFFKRQSGKIAATAILLGLTAQLAWQAWRANFVFASDQRNPYVYAQTVPDLLNLVRRIEAVASVSSAGNSTTLKVIAPGGDYWPLPWYLRRFKNIGWYDELPNDPYAPIIVVARTPKLDARLDEKSDKKWVMVGMTEMRPRQFFEMYVALELWKKYVATLPKERE